MKCKLALCLMGIDGDHSKAVKDIAKSGIDCYMTSETAEMTGFSGHRLKVIEPLKQFLAGAFIVMGFPSQHDCPGSIGFLISDGKEKLLFLTDSFYCRYSFSGLNIIAIECNYSEKTIDKTMNPARLKRLYSSHFSLENVLKFLKSTDLSVCREIHLIHLSGQNGDPEYFQDEVEKMTGIPAYIAKIDTTRAPPYIRYDSRFALKNISNGHRVKNNHNLEFE